MPDAGYLDQALAALIAAVPLHELEFDCFNFEFKQLHKPGGRILPVGALAC